MPNETDIQHKCVNVDKNSHATYSLSISLLKRGSQYPTLFPRLPPYHPLIFGILLWFLIFYNGYNSISDSSHHTLKILYYVHINIEAKPRLRGQKPVICIIIAHGYMVNWLQGGNIVSWMALGAAKVTLHLLGTIILII